jgi:hypothetical protein|tara:strand:+ start:902 stop:1135 length:234 start_codon:yes stop_codon:yes gene_type:complete
MKSFFVSILAQCMTAEPVFLDGDNWDIRYVWTCEEIDYHNKTIQIKAYAQYPISETTTKTDLFNRFPESEIDEVIGE